MIPRDSYMKVRRRNKKKLLHDDGRVSTAEACENVIRAFNRIWGKPKRQLKTLEEA